MVHVSFIRRNKNNLFTCMYQLPWYNINYWTVLLCTESGKISILTSCCSQHLGFDKIPT